jgi:hypothetical protein
VRHVPSQIGGLVGVVVEVCVGVVVDDGGVVPVVAVVSVDVDLAVLEPEVAVEAEFVVEPEVAVMDVAVVVIGGGVDCVAVVAVVTVVLVVEDDPECPPEPVSRLPPPSLRAAASEPGVASGPPSLLAKSPRMAVQHGSATSTTAATARDMRL